MELMLDFSHAKPQSPRLALHYLAAIPVIAVYGTQVCPFIEKLTPLQLLISVISMLGILLLLRLRFQQRWIEDGPQSSQTLRSFSLDLGLFVIGGSVLAIYNTAVYGFPIESGLKLLVGFITLGFFAAVDLALQQERQLANQLHETSGQLEVDDHYFPLTSKIAIVASSTAVFVLGVVFLVINKDLDWLVELGANVSMEDARRSILIEIIFVVGVILIHLLNIIRSFASNLRLFFGNENSALAHATHGRYNTAVPVSSNDEFGFMAKHTNAMIAALRERTEELQRTRDVTIFALASLAETRDNETGAHILRTQNYVKALAEHLRYQPKFSHELNDETIDLLYKSAPLHDVGKVGIPDAILLKPGKLTDEEFDIMKTHPVLGRDALDIAESTYGDTSFLYYAREIAYGHHEKWDGSGYPQGLQGEAIPLSARLMALADVYDALISKRVYKPAFSHEKARAIIVEGRGSHFDPDVTDAFLAVEEEFVRIARTFEG